MWICLGHLGRINKFYHYADMYMISMFQYDHISLCACCSPTCKNNKKFYVYVGTCASFFAGVTMQDIKYVTEKKLDSELSVYWKKNYLRLNKWDFVSPSW